MRSLTRCFSIALSLGLLMVVALSFTAVPLAEEPSKGTPSITPEKAQLFTLTNLLIRRGREAKDPMALVVAAKLIHDKKISISMGQEKVAVTPSELLSEAEKLNAEGGSSGSYAKVIQEQKEAIGGKAKGHEWVVSCYWVYYCDGWGWCEWVCT